MTSSHGGNSVGYFKVSTLLIILFVVITLHVIIIIPTHFMMWVLLFPLSEKGEQEEAEVQD